MPVTIGILVFDGVDELDFVGPLEVFGAANWGRNDIRVVTIGPRQDHFRGVGGLKFVADFDFKEAPLLDIVVVPGGLGVDKLLADAAALNWVRAVATSAHWVCSVCNGAFILQAAGLTEGRTITTHSGAVELLRSTNAGQSVASQRYVVDGNLVTSAGVSAGIDMSLWLVGQLHGEDHARAVRGLLDYYPEPPY